MHPTRRASLVRPSRSRGSSGGSAPSSPSTASTSPCPPAPSSACSARTAPARPPRCASSPRSCSPEPAAPRCSASTSPSDPQAVRERIGLAGQYAAVDENLTGRENLRLIGQLTHQPVRRVRQRADELLERFDLTDAADRPARPTRGGMRRRLDLAAALVHRPPVLFLDEPTTGLDPSSRNDLWDVIQELVGRGHHRAADDPVPRGGRPPGRPHRRHRPRHGDRRRHAGRAQGRAGRHDRRGAHARRPGRRPRPPGARARRALERRDGSHRAS